MAVMPGGAGGAAPALSNDTMFSSLYRYDSRRPAVMQAAGSEYSKIRRSRGGALPFSSPAWYNPYIR